MQRIFTITATNAYGTTQASASVDVAAPLPVGMFPNSYFDPNYSEYAFSDIIGSAVTHHWTNQILPASYVQFAGRPTPEPGAYWNAHNGRIWWNNKGGDWADANNVAQGPKPYASNAVNIFDGEKTWDVLGLVLKWLDGTYRNAGLWMRSSNGNTSYWRSKLWASAHPTDPTGAPFLRLTSTANGIVDLPCARNIRVNSSLEGALTGSDTFQCGGAFEATLLWFDLSPYSLADITGAVLHCTGSGKTTQTVNIFRCVNPAAPEGDVGVPAIGLPLAGIAANYPLDAGIENDPDVLFVCKWPANWRALWGFGGNNVGGNFGIVNTADANGYTPLPSGDPAFKYVFSKNMGYNFGWSPWRGGGQRLKPYVECEELFVRYFLTLGLDWNPLPDGGKLPGMEGRYTQLSSLNDPMPMNLCLGQGGGNSGTGTSGLCWSARMNYDVMPDARSPCADLRGIGSGDFYHADMTNVFGHDLPWSINGLGNVRKGERNCVELHIKMNSVTDTTQHPRQIISARQTGGVATILLAQPETDPAFVVGAVWNVQGFYQYDHSDKYRGDRTITAIIDANTFQYAVDPTAPAYALAAPSNVGFTPQWMWCAPCRGNFDGVLEGYRNGRLAARYEHIRFRHVKWRPDGGLMGIDVAPWMASFCGGDAAKTIGSFTHYIENVIVARKYIGPMLLP